MCLNMASEDGRDVYLGSRHVRLMNAGHACSVAGRALIAKALLGHKTKTAVRALVKDHGNPLRQPAPIPAA